ncbi:hypothetical protein [Kribbella sp. NPDC004875]|uniref:hypothetical protein n=1 Tax=Kribbella sp. NPDC004875 TaxID=3364107 RepID=UPI0036CBEF3D
MPRTEAASKPAVDCAHSDVRLPAVSDTDGVELTVRTDPSRTSLLVKNTGNLTVVVIPDANFDSRLAPSPYANPTDPASQGALAAVDGTPGGSMPEIPSFVPGGQVITVPPGWSTCALTDNPREVASIQYFQDRTSSAEYILTRGLAEQLLAKHSVARTRPVLDRCSKDTLNVVKLHPEMSDIELYAEILGAKSSCRAAYRGLLSADGQAADQLATTVLNRLASGPQLAPNSQLLSTTAAG